jgi:acetyltransferase-like isoleucine patch superfamily enzyme
VTIDDFVTIAPGANISGNVTLGFASSIGTGASVREKCKVGVEAVLGMGAALTKNLPDGETWVGVPAKRMG